MFNHVNKWNNQTEMAYNPTNPELVPSFLFKVFKDITKNYLLTAMIYLSYKEVESSIFIFDGDLHVLPLLHQVNKNPLVTTRFCCESHPENEQPIYKGYLMFVVSEEDKDFKVFNNLLLRLNALREKYPKTFCCEIEYNKPWLCLFAEDLMVLRLSRRYDEDELAMISSYSVLSPARVYPVITFRFVTKNLEHKLLTLKQLEDEFDGF